MQTIHDHFAVDKKGLAKLLERRGKSFAVIELIQNAWDENTTRVEVTLTKLSTGKYELVVKDNNPEGFADLAHAYTLFAESAKKDDPTKRGRFNMGEKLVIALCERAGIITTKGSVFFNPKGRTHSKETSFPEGGTTFWGELKLTLQDLSQIDRAVRSLIVPDGIETTWQGEPLSQRIPMTEFTATLATEQADEEGFLRPTRRKTLVQVFEVAEGETATLYEMGLPVVETGDKWHVNVMQKVPLNTDRDNVTPAYLRAIRTEVANAMLDYIEPEDAQSNWVNDALTSKDVNRETVEAIIAAKFGEDAVVYDPTDQEANKIAQSEGRQVIYGRSLSPEAWQTVKRFSDQPIVRPAGQVTPSAKPYSPDGKPLKVIPEADQTEAMRRRVQFAKDFAHALGLGHISVSVARGEAWWNYRATYGRGDLVLNFTKLGKAWFEKHNSDPDVIDLLIHEFGHHFESDHLSKRYNDALTRLAGLAVNLALNDPTLFADDYKAALV